MKETHTGQLMKELQELRQRVAELDASERKLKQAEAALAEERNLLRTVIDTLPEYIYAKDAQGRFILCNVTTARLMGATTPDNLIGKSDFAFYPRELAEQYFASEQPILREGKSLLDHEEPNIDATGRAKWDMTTKVPLRDSQGRIIGLVGVTRDISERKRAEEMLERRAMQLHTAAEVSHAASSILNLDELLPQTVELIRDRFNLYYVGLFLLDETERYAVLRAGTGKAGRKMLEAGHQLESGGTSMIGWCVTDGQARIALDVGEEAVRFDNPLLPLTRSEMALPLISRGQVIGAMTIQSARPADFAHEDITVLQTMTDQLATAIENARLIEATRRRAEEMTALNELSQALTTRLDVDGVVEEAYRQISRVMDTTDFYISLYDPAKNEVTFPIEVMNGKLAKTSSAMRANEGFTGYLIRTRKPLLIQNSGPDQEAKLGIENVTFRPGQWAVCWLGTPLLVGDRMLGTIAVMSYSDPQAFGEHDRDLLTAIASQVAIAIQNARLFDETRERNTELATLNAIISSASQTLDLRALLDMVLRQTLQVFGFDGGLITMYNETRHKLERVVRTGLPGSIPDDPSEGLENSLCAYVFNSKQALVIEDFRHGAPIDVSGEIESGYYSYIGVPLEVKGRMLGTWCGFRKIAGPFSKNTPALLQTVGHQIGFTIENARLFEQTQSARQQAELRVREMETLNRFTREVSSTLDLNHVLDALVNTLDQDMDFSHISLDLIDEPANAVRTVRAIGSASGMNGLVRPLDQLQNDITIDVARKGQIEIIDEWDDRFDRELFEREGHAKLIRAFVPLLLHDQALGVLEVGYQRGERAGILDEEINLLRSLADQVAMAVENARLFEQTQARAQELVILNEMSRTLSAVLDREAAIKNVYQNTSRLMDTTNFYVALYDPQNDEVSFPFYAEGERIRALAGRRRTGKGMTEYVIRTRQPLFIEENVNQRLAELGIESIGTDSQSWLGAPMLVGDQVIGVIAVQSYTTARLYNQHHRDLLTAIAGQVAIALQNAQLFEEARLRAEEMAALNELAQALASRLSVDQVLEQVHRGVSRLLDTTNFYISLYNPDKNEVTFPINVTESVVDKQITAMPADQGLTGYIIRTRRPLLIKEDVAGHLEKMGIPRVGEPAQSWLGVPLMAGDQVLGVMAIQSFNTTRAYNEHDREMLTAIGNQASIALQNAHQFEQTQAALAEVEATHRRYLREQWETYLSGEVDRTTGYVDGPQGLALADDLPPTSSALSVPIKLRGEPIGVLEFFNEGRPSAWSQDEQDLVSTLADQAALALENARLFEDTQSRAMRERMINEITARIRASMDMETILHTTAQELAKTLNLSRARIQLTVPEGNGHT